MNKVIFRGAVFFLCIGDFPFSFIVGALSVSANANVWQSTAMVVNDRHCNANAGAIC